ncbi:MAG: M1 family metallopeptidase, partial [Candidatus Omnitrophica bacterium]|nr:M1 family metallopeptidase [Candidatus Omnitrophota bacterium]
MSSLFRRVTDRVHRMIILVLLLTNVLFAIKESHAELLKPGRLPVVDYQIDAVINSHEKVISAKQKVSFTNPTANPTDELYFHLYANRHYTPREKSFMMRYAGYFKADPFPEGFPIDPVKIVSISLDGKPLAFSVNGDDKTILKVSLPKPLAGGEPVTIEMNYTVCIPKAYGRFGWHNNIFALSRWYPILAVYTDEGWSNYPFYPFHRPFFADAALYKVRLRVANNQVVVHTGDLVRETSEGSDKILEIETPLPVREFTMAMSPDYRVVEGKHNITTVKAYYLPGREKRGREALDTALQLMDFYSEKFGDYPYKTFSIAPVTLGYGGEQMSNLVFIDSRVYDLPRFLQRYFSFLIAHETGHQWFYNILGIDSYKEIWMEEGFNSYFLLEFLENKYGKNAGVIDLSRLPEWLKPHVPNLPFRKTTGVRYKMIARQGLDHP